MADPPQTLDYADGRRRRPRRRLTMAALVLSALACGVVGRLIYLRVAPRIAARFEAVAAQRAVDALDPIGIPYEVPPAGTGPWIGGDGDVPVQRVARRFLVAQDVGVPVATPIAITRLQNAQRRDRILCLSLQPAGTAPVDAITLVAVVTGPATLFGNQTVVPAMHFATLAPDRERFHLAAPTVDPNDRRRLLLTGVAGTTPFARELTLDADDRVQLRELPTTRPTTVPSQPRVPS